MRKQNPQTVTLTEQDAVLFRLPGGGYLSFAFHKTMPDFGLVETDDGAVGGVAGEAPAGNGKACAAPPPAEAGGMLVPGATISWRENPSGEGSSFCGRFSVARTPDGRWSGCDSGPPGASVPAVAPVTSRPYYTRIGAEQWCESRKILYPGTGDPAKFVWSPPDSRGQMLSRCRRFSVLLDPATGTYFGADHRQHPTRYSVPMANRRAAQDWCEDAAKGIARAHLTVSPAKGFAEAARATPV